MSEEHIWDYLSSRKIDITTEYKNLWTLLKTPRTVRNNSTSAFAFFNSTFVNFKDRDTFINLSDLLQSCGFYSKMRMDYEPHISSLDELDLFMEIILMCINEEYLLDKTTRSDIIFDIIKNNIKKILSKTNQKMVNTTPNEPLPRYIIIPDDEVVTSVADLILPSDEKLALSILGYTHYNKRNDTKTKRNILMQLGNYIEPKLRSKKDTDISYALNNWKIRHNTEKQINVSNEELNPLYDLLFHEILYYLLGEEHDNFKNEVNKLKLK